MEERLPPPALTRAGLPPLPLPPAAAHAAAEAAKHDTYVVQIPRDQIYRVPPPEHARIVESHNNRNAMVNSPAATRRRKTFFWATAVPIVLILAAVAAIFTIRATLYDPMPPDFSVARFQARNLERVSKGQRRPEFEVTLRAENPNERLSVSYEGGSGNATLVYKNRNIGHGKIPSTIEQEPGKGGDDLLVVLAGNSAALTLEIEKSLNGSTEKSMALVMEVGILMNSWIRNERRNIKVSCDFRFKNLVTNKNNIYFQECQTEF